MRRRVVVTGLGCVTALGCEVSELWDALCAGKSGIGPVRRFDVSTFKERYGLTRKYAIPLLEWLDRERVTRREGDRRLIIG